MPNPFFRFKSFTVFQDQCAMKVTTEACLLGAWFAAKRLTAEKILDIGGGTGLLSLMLAQYMPAQLYVIEKDDDAFRQMKQNIEASPWKDNIHPIHGDVLEYKPVHRFDFIITNPPFYENELKSPDARKNMALHDTSLTLEKLITAIAGLLADDGCFGILLPHSKTQTCIQLAAAKGFFPLEHLEVRQTPGHNFFRSILLFSGNKPRTITMHEMTIRDASGNYTDPFSDLLKSYYLHL